MMIKQPRSVAVHEGKPVRGLAVHDGAMEARLVLVAELLAGRPLFFLSHVGRHPCHAGLRHRSPAA
jgi:hypothetical protein